MSGRRSFGFFQLIRRSARRSYPVSLSALAVAGLATDASIGGTKTDPGLAFEFGLAYFPHSEKLAKGGEDAYFYNHSVNAFGVADGVGAWSTMGIDPAKFSRKLMRLSEYAIIENAAESEDKEQLMPTQAMRLAYDGVRRLGIQGSCTALIGILRDDALYMANLGDSGAMILSRNDDDDKSLLANPNALSSISLSDSKPDRRSFLESKVVISDDDSDQHPSIQSGYDIVYKTEDQQHRFNCPYQLGLESSDAPEASSVSKHTMKIGDLVIVGSDGLWDNLFDYDIQRLADESDDVTELAYIIANAASRRASKTRGARATPFAVDAAEAGIMFQGGKMDDITVIVAKVVPASPRLPPARARL